MDGSNVQAGPPNCDTQLLGGPPSGLPSRQMYQSRFGLLRDDRLSIEPWMLIRGVIRDEIEYELQAAEHALALSSRSKSSSVPKIGSMLQ